MDFPSDHALAARVARDAGHMLLDLREELARLGPDALRREGDLRSHRLIADALADAAPADAVLSEEAVPDVSRLQSRRVWIVDPLDGTREFGEPGRDDWAVHVALVVGGEAVVGAVALPARGMTLGTGNPPALPPPSVGRLRLVVSRSRRPADVLAAADRLGAEVLEMGSAGAKAMAVVLGEADVYAHSGGQYEWDSAAPVAVAAAAGLHVSRLDGSALRYNQADPSLPDLVVCRPELADVVLAALADC